MFICCVCGKTSLRNEVGKQILIKARMVEYHEPSGNYTGFEAVQEGRVALSHKHTFQEASALNERNELGETKHVFHDVKWSQPNQEQEDARMIRSELVIPDILKVHIRH